MTGDRPSGVRVTEADSRAVPWTREEFHWAHHRPHQHRVRFPAVGDDVLYRHDEWAEPIDATVIWVQPVDDVDDPNLCKVTADEDDRPLLFEGNAVMALRVDPWRRVHLRCRLGVFDTREARLRGAAGWLPLDWRARYRPVPELSPHSTYAGGVPVLGRHFAGAVELGGGPPAEGG